MSRWLRWLAVLLVLGLIAAFVARNLQTRRAEQARITAQRPPPGLDLAAGDVVVARRRALPRTLEVSGGLKAVNSAVVKARVAAEVRSLTVREGDRVKAGQVLGQLDTTEYDLRLRQAEQTAASTRSQLEIAQRALENNRALVAQGFISPTALESSTSNEAGARATLGAANAAVELARKSRGDARLVAPIDGLIAQRYVQPGERVSVDARLLEIVDLSRLELEAAVAPEDVVALQIGQRASLRIDGIADPVGARVARINPSAQAGTRAVMAYLALDPQPALRQGLFARGAIELGRGEALALPLSAVRTDQARPYVLQIRDGRAVATPVTLGERGSVGGQPWVAIVSGLEEGATVLTATAGLVRDGTLLRLAVPANAAAAASAMSTASVPRP